MPKPENVAPHKWEPGQSGNPAGLPKGTQHSKTRLKRLLEAVQTAAHPVTKEKEQFTTLELMDAALMAKALKGDVLAYRELLDRFEGKVAQGLELTGKDGGPIENSWVVEIEKPQLPEHGGTNGLPAGHMD